MTKRQKKMGGSSCSASGNGVAAYGNGINEQFAKAGQGGSNFLPANQSGGNSALGNMLVPAALVVANNMVRRRGSKKNGGEHQVLSSASSLSGVSVMGGQSTDALASIPGVPVSGGEPLTNVLVPAALVLANNNTSSMGMTSKTYKRKSYKNRNKKYRKSRRRR
jgi:hypothetical protein